MQINEKSLAKILKTQREEYQRYLGVLAEDFGSKTELIAESLLGLQDQLKAIKEMIAKNTEDIEMMKMDMHIIRNDVKEKASRDEFSILEKRVLRLEKALISTHGKK